MYLSLVYGSGSECDGQLGLMVTLSLCTTVSHRCPVCSLFIDPVYCLSLYPSIGVYYYPPQQRPTKRRPARAASRWRKIVISPYKWVCRATRRRRQAAERSGDPECMYAVDPACMSNVECRPHGGRTVATVASASQEIEGRD